MAQSGRWCNGAADGAWRGRWRNKAIAPYAHPSARPQNPENNEISLFFTMGLFKNWNKS
jgi:hypothetical protein